MYNFNAIIDGNEYKVKEKIKIFSPWDLKLLGTVSSLKENDINLAYKNSKESFNLWKNKTLLERIEIINRFKDLIKKHKKYIATIMVNEVGKNEKEALLEVDRTVQYIEYTIEESKRIHPKCYSGESFNISNKLGLFEYVPKGIILAISPFNYPLNLSLAKIIPALVMGNCVVFKPATNGSLLGSFLGKISLQANFPKGIFNVVTGKGKDIGRFLVTNKNIDLISFTGSVLVGNQIKKYCNGKELVLELGGKDPALVLDNKNLENVASEIIKGAFSFSGQRCTAIKKVITTNKIADKLVPLLKIKINNLILNNKENGIINPLISLKQANYVKGLINDAVLKKCKVICGNRQKNNFIYPTLLDFVTSDMKIAWEEPFGPVLPILRIENISEMIKNVNMSNFGLQASIFTNDIKQAFNISKKLDVGTVNINSKTQRGPDLFPFLGIKDSGQGVQGIRFSLLSSLRIKGIVFNY